jgi:pyridoxine 5-phosphate synthase
MTTRLSVNINKVALIRNARGGNLPDLMNVAADCERFGAQGITVHPRPDERHIRYEDVKMLKNQVRNEFNVEGNPAKPFMKLVTETIPDQVTLVPDEPDAITSDSGWDTLKHTNYLKEVIDELHAHNIRVSLFIDPDPKLIEGAAKAGADRIELYTGPFALQFQHNPEAAVKPYITAAKAALDAGLGINAGHDLNLENLSYLITHIPEISEVSIGHALICDALYFGLENTIQLYLRQLT